ncbi:MAG: pantetheine-phosphate adenylyltransferase [Treponema sp.]|uniref:pantetheine-phosphate adenylyltransferase n=1 Tax=Treponema sp. TaxID=166 RepID=UPI00298DDD6B|nr:pantetheine-phosphate adenylyltransferase [uncultured Treponema sp.]MBR0155412.1 pantetheine-phosphate adenylyltransferase [Treponema sp.]
MVKAVFPGSFDPPTFGHLNVIERTISLFDEIDVVVAVNPEKNYLFSAEERVEMLSELTKNYKNVKIHTWHSLIVDYAVQNNATVLLRGIRNATDFAYEFDLSLINHSLNSKIDTIFVPTEQKYVTIKSSSIKELARFGGDVSKMVPELVAEKLKEKFK